MNDKLDPGWVNDRLPTFSDADSLSCVFIFKDDKVIRGHFTRVLIGTQWGTEETDDPDLIATPQECIDREKEVAAPYTYLQGKVKDLEQALAKSEERVKMIENVNVELNKERKSYEGLRERNDILKKLLTQEWGGREDA